MTRWSLSLPTNVKVLYVLSKFLTHSTGENRVGLSFYVVHERIILFRLTEELPKKDNFFISKQDLDPNRPHWFLVPHYSGRVPVQVKIILIVILNLPGAAANIAG